MLLYFLKQEKNPKFEGLEISNDEDMAILRFLKNGNFVKIYYIKEKPNYKITKIIQLAQKLQNRQ